MLSAAEVADQYIERHPRIVCRGWVVTRCGWVTTPECVARYNALYGASLQSMDAGEYVENCDGHEKARVINIVSWVAPNP